MANTFTISDLRNEMGVTQTEFAIRLGLSAGGKPTVSLWETGAREVSFDAALKIEELSAGRIDAAQLNAQVARARAVGTSDHRDGSSVVDDGRSTGKESEISGQAVGA
jgi:transcriptional regulator with XRE-family HTH domain